jgi:hypothetical protein
MQSSRYTASGESPRDSASKYEKIVEQNHPVVKKKRAVLYFFLRLSILITRFFGLCSRRQSCSAQCENRKVVTAQEPFDRDVCGGGDTASRFERLLAGTAILGSLPWLCAAMARAGRYNNDGFLSRERFPQVDEQVSWV